MSQELVRRDPKRRPARRTVKPRLPPAPSTWRMKWLDEAGDHGHSEVHADTIVDAVMRWHVEHPETRLGVLIVTRSRS